MLAAAVWNGALMSNIWLYIAYVSVVFSNVYATDLE